MVWHEVALTGTHLARVQRADRRARAVPRQELAGAPQPQDRQPRLRASGGARHLSRRLPLPARRCHPAPGPRARRLRPGHRLAALSRARAGRVQGAKVVAPLARALRPGRPPARHPFLRPRSRPGDRAARSGRTRTRSRPAATTCCAPRVPSSAARRAATTSTPTPTAAPCSATTCTRCPPRSPTASAPRRCSPPGMPPSTSPRSTTSACGEQLGDTPLSRRHARGPAEARQPLVPG